MKVCVRLYAFLAEQVSDAFRPQYPQGIRSGHPLEVNLPEGSTLATLVDHLGLPEGQVKLTVVNGRLQEPDYGLQPEDEVGIFPPIAGG